MDIVGRDINWLNTVGIESITTLEDNPALGLSIWEQILNDAMLAGSPDFPDPETVTSRIAPAEGAENDLPYGQAVWTALPRHVPSTCALDSAILNLINIRRSHEATGGNIQEFQKAIFPSVQSLLNPPGDAVKAPLANSIVRDIVSALAVRTIPEQVAILYIMGVSIRWQISPTQYNYDAMPEWLRPTPSQIFNRHAAWLDTLAWPSARERLCRADKWEGKDVLVRRICEKTFSVNWPYEAADIFLHDKTEPSLNPVFEQHIRNGKNWTLGREILEV
ncbi:BZIP transcription factor [Paraphaeosphaeria sporulosa]